MNVTCIRCFRVCRLGMEEEDVGAAEFGNSVDVVKYTNPDIIRVRINNMATVDVDYRAFLSGVSKSRSATRYNAYQCNWIFVQNLGSHFVDHVRISRNADIGDESLEGSSLQCWYRFGFGRSDGSL